MGKKYLFSLWERAKLYEEKSGGLALSVWCVYILVTLTIYFFSALHIARSKRSTLKQSTLTPAPFLSDVNDVSLRSMQDVRTCEHISLGRSFSKKVLLPTSDAALYTIQNSYFFIHFIYLLIDFFYCQKC